MLNGCSNARSISWLVLQVIAITHTASSRCYKPTFCFLLGSYTSRPTQTCTARELQSMLSAHTHHCSQVRLGFRRAFCQTSGTTSTQHYQALRSPTHIRRSVAGHAAGQTRRATLTALLGSTVLAMGFGTSAMAASATSPTVESVRNPATDCVLFGN